MTELERRYRRALRLLPASYRQAREEEMVAVFLESMPPPTDSTVANPDEDYDDRDVPLVELASLLRLAVRARLGGVGASARSIAWGDAVRLVALLGLLLQSAYAVRSIVGSAALSGFGVGGPVAALPFDRVNLALLLLGLGWVAAFGAVLAGRRQLARLCVLPPLAVPAYAVWERVAGAASAADGERVWWVLSGFAPLPLAIVPVLALYAGFHRDAPPVSDRRRWLIALPVVAVAGFALDLGVFGVSVALGSEPPALLWALVPGDAFTGLAPLAALGGLALLILRRTGFAASGWPLALGLLLVPTALARLALVGPSGTAAYVGLLGALAVVLVVGGVRRLPAGAVPAPPRK